MRDETLVPEDELRRQLYYIGLLRPVLEEESRRLGRPYRYWVVTLGCQMNAHDSEKIIGILREAGVPCLLSQYRYNLLTRDIEKENLPLAAAEGSGFVAFSPLCQGLLTDKYLDGTIPAGSRAARPEGFLRPDQVTPEVIDTCRRLNALAQRRGQTLSQMALAWALRDERVTSVIIGTRTVQQMDSSLAALHNLDFTPDELAEIDAIAPRPH